MDSISHPKMRAKGAALARVQAVSPSYRASACAALRCASSFPLRYKDGRSPSA
jgi:hypothetical protein